MILDEIEIMSEEEQPVVIVRRDPELGLLSPHRHQELEWRRQNKDLLQTYAGQWVVLEGDRIIAHGKAMSEPVAKAREQGIQVPYVFYVEEYKPDVINIGL